jgi:hypothetical protein
LESQLEEIQANLDEVKQHEREAKTLLNKYNAKSKRTPQVAITE